LIILIKTYVYIYLYPLIRELNLEINSKKTQVIGNLEDQRTHPKDLPTESGLYKTTSEYKYLGNIISNRDFITPHLLPLLPHIQIRHHDFKAVEAEHLYNY
jgi:hypothetical protein